LLQTSPRQPFRENAHNRKPKFYVPFWQVSSRACAGGRPDREDAHPATLTVAAARRRRPGPAPVGKRDEVRGVVR